MLVIFSGLPGTGKTTLARELARQIGAVYLRIDSIEHGITSAKCLYGPMNDAGYRVGYQLAADNLAIGRTVVTDSVNPLSITRQAWRAVAIKACCPRLEIEMVCSDTTEHKKRIEGRQPDLEHSPLPTWQEVCERHYEARLELWEKPHLTIDTADASPEFCCERIITALQAIRTQRAL